MDESEVLRVNSLHERDEKEDEDENENVESDAPDFLEAHAQTIRQMSHAQSGTQPAPEIDHETAARLFMENVDRLKSTIASTQAGRSSFMKLVENGGPPELENIVDDLVIFFRENIWDFMHPRSRTRRMNLKRSADRLRDGDGRLFDLMEQRFYETDAVIVDLCLSLAWQIHEMDTAKDNIEIIHVPSLSEDTDLVNNIMTADASDLSDFLKGYILELVDKNGTIKGAEDKHSRTRCAGCGGSFRKDGADSTGILYRAPSSPETTYAFHDEDCVTLQKYKEEIRRFALKVEDDISEFADTSDYILHMIRKKQSLIGMEGRVYRPGFAAKVKDSLPAFKIPINIEADDDDKVGHIRHQRHRAFKLINGGADNLTKSMILNIPEKLRVLDGDLFGRPVWEFCMDNLLIKNDRKALWDVMEFLATDLPTLSVIGFIEGSDSNLSKLRLAFIQRLCTGTIEGSKFPMATALTLSNFLRGHASRDLARQDEFLGLAEMCVSIAFGLLDQIESDHLLAILLEIPTDLENESTFDIAIKYRARRFLNHVRVGAIMSRMWSHYRYLEPTAQFKQESLSYAQTFDLLWEEPLEFYFSPIGKFYVNLVTYFVYVAMVTWVAYPVPIYPYDSPSAFPHELYMWIANVGFALFELQSLSRVGSSYFRSFGNMMSMFIAVIWMFCFFVRFAAPAAGAHVAVYDISATGVKTLNASASRDLGWNRTYMLLFSLQLILIWSRIVVLFERSPTIGPLLQMIQQMTVNVLYFMLITFIIFFGFMFALVYIIANESPGITTVGQTFLFTFESLLSQQNWPDVDPSAPNGNPFGKNRSDVAYVLVVMWSIMGAILLLNLLIAVLASSYADVQDVAALEVNFSRFSSTYTFTHRSTTMSPPFNLIVVFTWGFLHVFDRIIVIFSCGGRLLSPPNLGPIFFAESAGQPKDESENASVVSASAEFLTTGLSRAFCCGCASRHTYNMEVPKQTAVTKCQQGICCGAPTYACVPINTGKNFCRFCRQQIIESGTIHQFTGLFTANFDEGDVELLDRLLAGRGLCCYCFRPYSLANGTNRLTLAEVMDSALSYYVFMPMRFILLLLLGPIAVIDRVFTQDVVLSAISEKTRDSIQSDETHREHIREVIDRVAEGNRETQDDLDDIDEKLTDLKGKLEEHGGGQLHDELHGIRSVIAKLFGEIRNKEVGNILEDLGYSSSEDERRATLRATASTVSGLLDEEPATVG